MPFGSGSSEATAPIFEAAGIPRYATESDAVGGFMHLVRYREALDALMAMPPSLPQDFKPDVAAARLAVADAVREGRKWLDPLETARLLDAYAIPVAPVLLARTPEEAASVAAPLLAEGSTVVAKILSPDIVHKSEVGGVRLNLTSERAVREAVADILARARAARPDANIRGVTIHPMILRPKARELIAGIADDPTFGPVVVFGRGGTAVEVIDDKALALPPLDLVLARALIARTRVSRVLKAYRDVPAADGDAIALVLVKLAQLAADLPELRELDLNPLLADHTGVIAVDARVAVAPVDQARRGPWQHPRFAIRPYPKEWERPMTLRDGTRILVRPVRPEDEPLYGPFFAAVTAQDLRLRFFAPLKDFGHAFVARLTQIDYARAMAFIAIEETTGNMLGVVRLHADANYVTGEYAILVRSDLKGRGLGWLLMQTDDRLCARRRPQDHRGPGAAREHHHAGDVQPARLRHLAGSARSRHLPGGAAARGDARALTSRSGTPVDIVVAQDAQRRALDVVVLAAAQRPQERRQAGEPERQRHRHKINENVHDGLMLGSNAPPIAGVGARRLLARAAGAQRVERHQHRGARHRHRGEQRRHEARDRERHRDGIVDHRQREVLRHQPARAPGDRERVEHRPQPVAEKHRVGLRLGEMGGADRRQRDMRGRERGRIVQPVADHEDAAALRLEQIDDRDLLHRVEPGEPLAHAQRRRNRRDRGRPVARQDDHVEPARLERLHHGRRVGTQLLLERRERRSCRHG